MVVFTVERDRNNWADVSPPRAPCLLLRVLSYLLCTAQRDEPYLKLKDGLKFVSSNYIYNPEWLFWLRTPAN